MKAIFCTKYGNPEVLKLVETAKPFPKENEILIKIFATSVTAADIRIRRFNVPISFWIPARLALGLLKPKKPILGMELSGEVESTGKNVNNFKIGDQVFAFTGHVYGFGAYAQYRCIPENGSVALKPKNVTYEEASVIPLGGLTALHFIKTANIQNGQKILIYGASGSVGSYAVQLAKYYGAIVTGVCSTANLNLVKSLGADHVIDYTGERFDKCSEKYDVIFDAVGKSSFFAGIRALKNNGKFLTVLATPGKNMEMLLASLLSTKKFIGGTPSLKKEDLLFLKNLVESGNIRCIIDKRYSLEDIVEAHRYVDQGHKIGNVVITVGHDC